MERPVLPAVHGGIRGLFEGLVPAEVIEAYDRLLASNGCAKEQAEALVGDAGLVATLTGWGMAHIQPHSPRDPAWLRPASPDLALQGPWPVIRRGLPGIRNCCRSIYGASVMDDPAGRRIVRACAAAGEQARLLPRVPMKMKLADHTTALLPLTPAGTAGALVIRAPVIITALREYFELLWDRATPLSAQRPAAPDDRLTPTQQAILEMMARGPHDQTIARQAGISVTTDRRHITAIMKRLGVSSRFAAGAAAQRRGWIG